MNFALKNIIGGAKLEKIKNSLETKIPLSIRRLFLKYC